MLPASNLDTEQSAGPPAQPAIVSDQLYRDLFESIPLPAWVVDCEDLRVLAVNTAATEQYGWDQEDFLRLKLTDLLSASDAGGFCRAVTESRHGSAFPSRWRHVTRHGSLLDVELTWKEITFGGKPAVFVLSTDLSRRLRYEKRALVFSDLGRKLSSCRAPKEAANAIVEAADLLFGWDACLFDLLGPGNIKVTPVLAIDTIDGRRTELPPGSEEVGPLTREAIEHGPKLILRSPGEALAEGARLFGDKTRRSASIMSVLVQGDDRAIAVLSIQSYATNAYTERDLRVLQSLAEHCGGALERIRAEEEIDRLHRELRSHLEELQTLIEVAPVGIVLAHDPACRALTVNAAGAVLFGLSPTDTPSANQLDSRNLRFKVLRNGKELSIEEFPMNRAARQGATIAGEEFELQFPDGHVISCYSCASPLFDDSGQVRGSLGVWVNLTERKIAEREILRLNAELERRVRDRTNQLEAINKELEAFSYSVSHDLRAPLRSIRGFSEVLLERYGGELDGRGQEFLKRTCESCAQMDKLIEDLLKLSRVGRSEMQLGQVDLSAIAEAIASELKKSEPNRSVEFRIAPGLQAHGDERLLRLVMDNLLRNAWKFTRHQAKALIEFGLIDHPERAFYIRDNGAGFDMTYASKLFGVFQRLHTASEFPGTGVGLATVQRIINRHGGRAWGEGAVNHGATFYFTLPSDGQI